MDQSLNSSWLNNGIMEVFAEITVFISNQFRLKLKLCVHELNHCSTSHEEENEAIQINDDDIFLAKRMFT